MIVCKLSNSLEVYGLPESFLYELQHKCRFDLTFLRDDTLPNQLNLFSKNKDSVTIPRGLFYEIEAYSQRNNLPLKLEYQTCNGTEESFTINPKINYKTGIFHYQDRIINELKKYHTVRLESAAGSGKTAVSVLFTGIINKGPVLFLANKDRLLRQFINTVSTVLQIPKDQVGIIKANKRIIKNITAGSLQTIGKDSFDLDSIKNTFYIVFMDECHISTALTYRKVLLSLAPRYLIGLSATPEHYSSDELNRLMDAMLGPIAVKVFHNEIPGRIIPEIYTRETGRSFRYKARKESPEFVKHKCRNKLYSDIATDFERNRLILNDCWKLLKANHKILITVQRVSHGQNLHDYLTHAGISCSFPYTFNVDKSGNENFKVNHKQLDLDVDRIDSGEVDVLIGTYSLFQTGFDCKPLSAILLASPFSGTNTTMIIQAVGRIQRHSFNKTNAVVIDYVDDSYPTNLLRDWANSRETFFKKTYNNSYKLSFKKF